jgi:hypothetical protein
MSAVCPECATPVAMSVRGDLLREADPDWLRKLHLGCTLADWGIWILWLSYVFSHVFAHLTTLLLTMPATLAAAVGTWTLASPDPSGMGEDRYGASRLWARGLGIVQFAAVLFAGLSATAPPLIHLSSEGLRILTTTGWGAATIWYLAGLGERAAQPKDRAVRRSNLFFFFLVSLISLVTWAFQNLGHGWGNPFAAITGFPLSWLNVMIVYGAISGFRKVLKAEVAAALGRNPSAWRKAGTTLRWTSQFFRRENGDDKK